MKTFYYTGYAVTHFETPADYYQFIQNPSGLELLDVDPVEKRIKWRF